MDQHDGDEENSVQDPQNLPRPGGRLSGVMVVAIREGLLKDGVLFGLSDEGIARHFVQPFFSGNAFRAPLAELRDTLVALDGCPKNVPTGTAFAPWVRKVLLDYAFLPRDKLAELYADASRDLRTIEENIEDCRQRLSALERESPKSADYESEVRFANYYLQKNKTAREEIVSVLANRATDEAHRAALGGGRWMHLFPLFLSPHVPWSFRWFPDRYSLACYSPVSHWFGELDLNSLDDLRDAYAHQEWERFDYALNSYIERIGPVAQIRSMLESHHLLAGRAQVLNPALDAFERGDLSVFMSIVAIQIEGIFEDACLLAGVAPSSLRSATLTPKLDALLHAVDVRFDYVYYAFKFPALRNHVAHGRLVNADLSRVCGQLLLDLLDVCQVIHHPFARNAMVAFLKKRGVACTLAEALEFLALLAESTGEPPDPFYSVSEPFQDLRAMISDGQLWSSVLACARAEAESDAETLASGLKFIMDFLVTRDKQLKPTFAPIFSVLRELGSASAYERDAFRSALQRSSIASHIVHVNGTTAAMLFGVLLSRKAQLVEGKLANTPSL